MTKRKYVGYRIVKEAVLDYVEDDGSVRLTAREIATVHRLNPRSVRMAAKLLKLKLPRDPNWGGVRKPSQRA
jgi:hypothetical protein